MAKQNPILECSVGGNKLIIYEDLGNAILINADHEEMTLQKLVMKQNVTSVQCIKKGVDYDISLVSGEDHFGFATDLKTANGIFTWLKNALANVN